MLVVSRGWDGGQLLSLLEILVIMFVSLRYEEAFLHNAIFC